MLEKLDFACN